MDIHSFASTSDIFLRKALYEAHEGKCFYTGQFIPIDELEVDHIIPVSKGGLDCFVNYVPTTHFLNMKKLDNYEPLLCERMIYINTIVFAPKVVELYSKLITSGKARRIALVDFLRLNGVQVQKGKLPQIKQNLRGKASFVFEVPPGRQKPQPMFDIEELHNLLEHEPSLFFCGANVRPERHKSDGSCYEAERSKK